MYDCCMTYTDLSQNNFFFSDVSNNWLILTNSWFHLKKSVSNTDIPRLPFTQDTFIDRWLKIEKKDLI